MCLNILTMIYIYIYIYKTLKNKEVGSNLIKRMLVIGQWLDNGSDRLTAG